VNFKIDLSTAVAEIRTAYDTPPARPPFFFIVGSGISYPSVPIAADIIEHCKERTLSRGANWPDLPDMSPLALYSFWFDKAYPQPIDRQRYFRSLIENRPITDANLRLAHALSSRRITNLVVTSNFDDLLSRSLGIFGEAHIVSDHPQVVDRIDLDGNDLQVVHVHGSYRFYDCRNLQEELENRAIHSPTSTNTMAAFLDRALSFRSPIVVGYAGWESDVIMNALRRRLYSNTLPYRLYWCCYREDDLQLLPRWLTEHNDVRIVVRQPAEKLISVEPERTSGERSISSVNADNMLPAQIVFESLSRAFALGEPALTKDPLAFFAKQLRASIQMETGREEAVYFFSEVVSRIERAAELEQVDRNKTRQSKVAEDVTNSTLSEIKDHVRGSRYEEAAKAAVNLPISQLSSQDLLELFDILSIYLRGEGQVEESSKESDELLIKSVELLISIGSKVVNLYDADPTKDSTSIIRFTVQPLIRKAGLYEKSKRYQDAISIYDDITRKFQNTGNDDFKWYALYSLTRKALALGALQKTEQALSAYDLAIRELRRSKDDSTRWLLAQSMHNRIVDLVKLGRREDVLTAVDEYLTSFEKDEDAFARVLLINALRMKAAAQQEFGDLPGAIQSCIQAETMYGNDEHSQVIGALARVRKLKRTLETLRGPGQQSPSREAPPS
jgi:tetratricopeptide (TPR) repeat protein